MEYGGGFNLWNLVPWRFISSRVCTRTSRRYLHPLLEVGGSLKKIKNNNSPMAHYLELCMHETRKRRRHLLASPIAICGVWWKLRDMKCFPMALFLHLKGNKHLPRDIVLPFLEEKEGKRNIFPMAPSLRSWWNKHNNALWYHPSIRDGTNKTDLPMAPSLHSWWNKQTKLPYGVIVEYSSRILTRKY